MAAPRVYDSSLTADAPHFAPPSTPSRSPFKADTLHRRSPTKQLRAKATLNQDEYNRIVTSDISTAAEKELASRVVKAADKLKDWCREIEQWGWSGNFDKRPGNDLFKRQTELKASLSPGDVQEYDARLDRIDQELADLEIDDLKEQILGIHQGRSRPSSSYSTTSTTNVVLYDDFQLFVTETLLHVLPYHMKLRHYLRIWHVRLSIFEQIPTYLDGLQFLEEILKEAWQGLGMAGAVEMSLKDIDELDESLTSAQLALKDKVTELGRQLDRMLDMLEGQEDCLPDPWIDKYEENEKSYGEWSYEADRKLFRLRHMERRPQTKAVLPPVPDVAVIAKANMAIEELDAVPEVLVRPVEDDIPQTMTENVAASGFLHEEPELEASILSTIPDMSFPDVDASTPPLGPKDLEEDRNFTDLNEHEKHEWQHGDPYEGEPVIAEDAHKTVDAVLRRASMASIESFTRDQVKSVEVLSRRNSGASFSSVQRPTSRSFDSVVSSPHEARKSSRMSSPLATEPTAAWPDILPSIEDIPRPQTPLQGVPTIRRNSTSSVASSATDRSDDVQQGDESPSVRASMHKPPLNLAMKKRRGIDSARATSVPFPDQDLDLLGTNPASPTKLKSPTSTSIPLDEQIEHILESMPTARIRLRASALAKVPDGRPKHRPRKSSNASTISAASEVPSATRPGLRPRATTPSLFGRSGITLAPADDQGPRRGGANEPEIKVYNLTSGNDKPLKLFIRRVGENGERVMVRVGGGWADLGDYLRSYAEHHGHRAVSDGRVEVLGLGNDRAATPTPGSNGRTSALGTRSASPLEGEAKGESRVGHSRRSSLISSIGYPSINANDAQESPTAQVFDSQVAAPSSVVATPSSGLIGPAAAKKILDTPLSSEKQDWIEGVVEQAKKVGRKGVEFGDLGKKGGTRRVFLKGGRIASSSGALVGSPEKAMEKE